jgi:uncharacterized protein YdhG (YjbR/CyaY superfamily)
MPIERMPDPLTLIPGAEQALTALEQAIAATGLDARLLALCRRRTAETNGFGDGPAGATDGCGDGTAGARTAEERAVLALTDAVTRLDPVPDQLWDRAATHFDQRELAALLLTVAVAGARHRLTIPTRRGNTMTRTYEGFTEAERGAMKERARELKNGAKESEVLAKIAEMSGTDRELGEALHTLIREAAPGLTPKLWYGMPAYARDGKVVCFFQPAAKFKSRYAVLGFSDEARLDDGDMWPTYFAITELSAGVASRISALVGEAA